MVNMSLLTIELLDALNIILRKPEVFSEGVNGGHQCARILRVLQAKCMTKLVCRHQEQTVAWNRGSKPELMKMCISSLYSNITFVGVQL